MVFKIEIEREMCITCGNCVNECDTMFEIGEDDYSSLIDGKINEENYSIKEYDDIGCGIEAAEVCPVACITVFENDEVIDL